MEFHEKLQQLRKQKGLTQEELAQELYVSRAAVSKWESGRGYPNIDSLKLLAKFYGVTVDELLSGQELLAVAEEDRRQSHSRFRDLVFGLLDVSSALFFVLPFFGQKTGETVRETSLLALTGIASYLKAAYLTAVIGMLLWGVLTLALQNCSGSFWLGWKNRISLLLNIGAVLLFILSPQPYAAAFLLVFLAIKVFLLIKKP